MAFVEGAGAVDAQRKEIYYLLSDNIAAPGIFCDSPTVTVYLSGMCLYLSPFLYDSQAIISLLQ
jgi:hypothetical protein